MSADQTHPGSWYLDNDLLQQDSSGKLLEFRKQKHQLPCSFWVLSKETSALTTSKHPNELRSLETFQFVFCCKTFHTVTHLWVKTKNTQAGCSGEGIESQEQELPQLCSQLRISQYEKTCCDMQHFSSCPFPSLDIYRNWDSNTRSVLTSVSI